MQPANRPAEAHEAPSLQRSEPALSGITAASPTPKIWSSTIKDSEERSNRRPRRKNGSAAIQLQVCPPMTSEWLARPAIPCQEKPTETYTIAATAETHSEDNTIWAALRLRPSPEFTIARPAPAKGTSRMRRKHSVAEL